MARSAGPRQIAGWREWVALPDLGIAALRAKLDSGARTSALHASGIEPFRSHGHDHVRFHVHVGSGDERHDQLCRARVADRRRVVDSGGHPEVRWIIETQIRLGGEVWTTEVSLTDRSGMRFRMLIGRTAMARRVMMDPAASYRLGRPHDHRSHSHRYPENA